MRTISTLPLVLALSSLLSPLLGAACGKDGGATGDDPALADKKAHEAAIADLKQPIALIAGYSPYTHYPEPLDKFFPARHVDWEKSTLVAANEVRYAANKARQKLDSLGSPATKDLAEALKLVTVACAEADDQDKLAKCTASITALDAALGKATTAASALGVTAKYPRIGPDAVTDEARAAMAKYLKARGPGDNEKAWVQKRNDPGQSQADLSASCQAADTDAAAAAQAYEKDDESIRLVAATRKMSMDSQCRRVDELSGLAKDLAACRKKPNTADCKATCGKMKIWMDEGFPAAGFAPVGKDFADICKQ